MRMIENRVCKIIVESIISSWLLLVLLLMLLITMIISMISNSNSNTNKTTTTTKNNITTKTNNTSKITTTTNTTIKISNMIKISNTTRINIMITTKMPINMRMNFKNGRERMDKESSSSMMITTTITKTTITALETTTTTTIRTIMIIITIKTITIISRKKTKELVNKISSLTKKSLAHFIKIMMRILNQSLRIMKFWLLSITMEASRIRISQISSIFTLVDMANPAPLSKAVINSKMFKINSMDIITHSRLKRKTTPILTFSTLEVHKKPKMTNVCQTSVRQKIIERV